jgi:exopolysaccharide production protein ExoY
MSMVSPRDLVAVARQGSAVSKNIAAYHLIIGWLTPASHFDADREVLRTGPMRKAAAEADHALLPSYDADACRHASGGGFNFREPTDEYGMTPIGGRRKRVVDIVVALAVAILTAPLLLALAIAVKLSMGGPVIYRHRRIGFAGRPFDCLKFRTMVANGDELLEHYLAAHPEAAEEWRRSRKLINDPRITRLGWFLRKTSLDELPQLLNILRGEMSCVGPRPIVTEELERYGIHAHEYLRARPGVTGSWQVSGRSNVSYRDRVRLDAEYVREWSFGSDLWILARTVPAVLKVDQAA